MVLKFKYVRLAVSYPAYSLGVVKNGINNGNYRITFSALQGAVTLGFNEEDIKVIGLNLLESDFKKSMSAKKRPGTMQDVYNPVYKGIELYYKVQLVKEVIIIS